MKQIWALLVAIVVIGAAVWFGMRLAKRPSEAVISSLLPRGTIALAELPDFNGTVKQWHRSDIYLVFKEPAVQEFLQKPSSRATKNKTVSAAVNELQELDPKDAFLALVSLPSDKPKVVAGFRFDSDRAAAKRIVADWRVKLGNGKRHETVKYQQHEIEIISEPAFPLALVQNRDWFFASNDIDELKQVLDRADGRMKDRASLLRADPAFTEAMHAMPSTYAVLFYLQPKTLSDKIAAIRSAVGSPAGQKERAIIEQIRSVCASAGFEDGKMRDVIFLGAPQQKEGGRLTRATVSLGTRDTFFYVASLINFSKQAAMLWSGTGANFLGTGIAKITNALNAAGVGADDWNVAFGSEAGVLANWPQDMRWPYLFASTPVKDSAHAKKIVGALLRGIDEDAVWDETEQAGVHYWSMRARPSLLPVRLVVGLSNRALIAGLDLASIQAAFQRSESGQSELASSDSYKRAEHSVPEPTNFFSYLDVGLFYSRLDSALRPLLMMAGAFAPKMNDYVDLNKLPAPEVITKHLSPIVCSQRYAGNGYIAESIGPITFNQAGIGVATLAAFSALGYQKSGAAAWSGLGFPSGNAPPANLSPGTTSPQPTSGIPKQSLPSPTGTP